MSFPRVICTLGPSCNTKEKIFELSKAGVDIFRINLSHANIDDIYNYHKYAKELKIDLGLDTEGAQLRTKLYDANNHFIENENIVIISKNKITSKEEYYDFNFGLYPLNSYEKINIGTLIRIDFEGVVLKVIDNKKDYIKCLCISKGGIGNNKGVDILNSNVELPGLTKKDINALKIAEELNIKYIFASFCQSEHVINQISEIVNDGFITAKIESKKGIHNLHEICKISSAILIDRGDLSREINLLDIPFAQRGIIKVCEENKIPCYIATNVLESLIKGNLPTRAELNDIVSNLEMGAHGIVLAAETAIGNKPILSVEIVKELIHRFLQYKSGLLFVDLDRNEISDPEMKIWLNRTSLN